MASDSNQQIDDVTVEVNPAEAATLPSLPERPADSAKKAKWVDYVVALGADRDAAQDMTATDLADYATRLGG